MKGIIIGVLIFIFLFLILLFSYAEKEQIRKSTLLLEAFKKLEKEKVEVGVETEEEVETEALDWFSPIGIGPISYSTISYERPYPPPLGFHDKVGEKYHLGVDFRRWEDYDVYAISDAVVYEIALVSGYGRSYTAGDPGGALILEFKAENKATKEKRTFYALYGHVKNMPEKGQRVKRGEVIASINEAEPPDLHFAISFQPSWRGYDKKEGSYFRIFLDPWEFFRDWSPISPDN